MRKSFGLRATSVLLLATTTAGCSVGERQGYADAVHATRDRLERSAAVAGTLTYDLQLHERSRAEFAQLAGTAAPDELELITEVVLDPAGDRAEVRFGAPDLPAPAEEEATGPLAALAAAGAEEAPPAETAPAAAAPRPVAALFEGPIVHVKRQNLRARERRTWARLDFEQLSDEEPRPTREDLAGSASLVALATTLNPIHVADLATGALAGSTERKGTVTLEDGTRAIRYTANVSVEKSLSELDLDDDEVETRNNVFRLLGFRSDVVPGEFWLSEDGSLRRMRLEVPQYVNRRRSDHLVVTLDLPGPAPTGVAVAPADDETVTYERYGRLFRAAIPAPVPS